MAARRANAWEFTGANARYMTIYAYAGEPNMVGRVGHNLQVLRDSIASESVDLIYLDPSFNLNATYKVGLHRESGRDRVGDRTAAWSYRNGKCSSETQHTIPRENHCARGRKLSQPPDLSETVEIKVSEV